MAGLSIAALVAASALLQAPPPEWRVASFNSDMITYVDAASIARDGDGIRFGLAMRFREHRSGGPPEIREQIEGDCVTRRWKSVRSWPGRENGREVVVRETLEMQVAPGTVYGATLRAACERSFETGAVADPDRHAAAYLAAGGSTRLRLAAAGGTGPQPGGDGSPAPGASYFTGLWTEDGNCDPAALSLNADGTFRTRGGGRGTWSVSGDKLTFSGPSGSRTLPIEILDSNNFRAVGSPGRTSRCAGGTAPD
ncbi:MAG TPA: surface-adhesin E family protein [Allosphingosinicella sp.]|jgi:hypothetical protein